MEETREFAALDMPREWPGSFSMTPNSLQSNLTAPDEHVWEWSSKHTRLRYQLILSSIVVFYVATYPIEQFAVPILFAKITDGYGPSKTVLLTSTIIFYVFTLTSIFVRSQNERKQIGLYNKRIAYEVNRVHASLSNLNDHTRSLSEKSKYDFPELKKVQKYAESLHQKINDFPETILKIINQATHREEPLSFGPDGKPNYLKQDILAIQKDCLQLMQKWENEIWEQQRTAKKDLKTYNKVLLTALSTVEDTFKNAEKQIAKILATESRKRRTHFLEREIFGLWAPALASAFIVIMALTNIMKSVEI